MKKHFEPIQQGEYDGLCGVYAILNAVLAVTPKFNDDDCTVLFYAMMRTLANGNMISVDALWDGFGPSKLDAILETAKVVVKKRRRRTLTFERFKPARGETPRHILKRLSSVLDGNAVAIILVETKNWIHWTVVSKIGRRKVWLLDSSKWISFRRSRLSLKGGGSKIKLRPSSCRIIRSTKFEADGKGSTPHIAKVTAKPASQPQPALIARKSRRTPAPASSDLYLPVVFDER